MKAVSKVKISLKTLSKIRGPFLRSTLNLCMWKCEIQVCPIAIDEKGGTQNGYRPINLSEFGWIENNVSFI